MPINYVSKENLQEFATKLNEKQKTIFAPISSVGAPLTAETAAAMTDETKVYVYTGEEVGYTYGNWYYHDGTGWVSGGVYNATVYETDTTLTESGKPADAKAAGDAIDATNDRIDLLYNDLTESGPIVAFEGIGGSAISGFSSTIVPIQPGSDDPSPENIRPIYGYSTITIYKAGKNLFNKNSKTSNSYVKADGTLATGIANTFSSGYIPVKAGQAYRYNKLYTSNVTRYIAFYDYSKTFVSSVKLTYTGGTVTAPDGAAFVRICGHPNYLDTIMFVVGTAAVGAYEEYKTTTKTVTIPESGTVYAGTATIEADGSCTVKSRPYYAEYDGETLTGPWISDRDTYSEGVTPTTGAQVVDLGGDEETITISNVGTLTALEGRNNVWTTSGDTVLTYKASPMDLIEQNTENIEVIDTDLNGEEVDWTSYVSFTDDKQVRADNGKYLAATTTKATKSYINVSAYTHVRYMNMQDTSYSSTPYGLAFYSATSEGAYISGVAPSIGGSAGGIERVVKIPNGAKYMRLTYWSDSKAEEYEAPAFYCYLIRKGLDSWVSELDNDRPKPDIIDNLVNGSGERIQVISGTYGAANASYYIPMNDYEMRCVVDFKITRNLNVGDSQTQYSLLNVYGATRNMPAYLLAQKPSLVRYKFDDYDLTYYQFINYRSGCYIAGTPVVRNSASEKPLVGNNVFSIWVKGSYSDTEPTAEELTARSEWLAEYQDLAIVCENDRIAMIRDGIGATGDEFNNGETSTLWEVSLKDDQEEYKTLRAVYQEIAAYQTEYNFVLRFYDLSYRKTCADLLQFGKVKLVGRYNQQIDPASSSHSYYYDSYPVSFPFAVDDTWHTIDVVKKGSKIWMSMDGKCFKDNMASVVTGIRLYGGSVTFRNLEIYRNGSFGDADVIDSATNRYDIIVSSRIPLINVLMGHDMITTYEGSGLIDNTQKQSLTRVEDIIKLAIDKGYSIVSLDEFHSMYTGRAKMPKRVALFILDDHRVAEAYQDLRNRSVVSKYGVTLNFATINSSYNSAASEDANFKLFTSMRGNGWCCCSHSYRHDVRFGEKNSVLFVWELRQIQKDADKLNWLNDVIVANGLGGTRNQFECMENGGFRMAFHNTGSESFVKYTNPYMIGRTNIGDNGQSPTPFSVLV